MTAPNTQKEPPRIIAGFPGVGKTFATKCLTQLFDMMVSDSDSSKFPKEGFPANYIDHIRQLYEEGSSDIIFVSSHDVVREALIDAGLPFTLVYPSKDLKKEYLRRYMDRKSPQGFIDLVETNWDTWLDECDACVHQDVTRIELPDGDMTMYVWILVSKGILRLSPETGEYIGCNLH